MLFYCYEIQHSVSKVFAFVVLANTDILHIIITPTYKNGTSWGAEYVYMPTCILSAVCWGEIYILLLGDP